MKFDTGPHSHKANGLIKHSFGHCDLLHVEAARKHGKWEEAKSAGLLAVFYITQQKYNDATKILREAENFCHDPQRNIPASQNCGFYDWLQSNLAHLGKKFGR